MQGNRLFSISIGNDQSQANKPEPDLPTRRTIDQVTQTKKKATSHKQGDIEKREIR
jgi:hypothetical protein